MEIVSTQSAQYTYDANGNVISRFDAAGRWYFYWDAENRLVRVVKPGWRPLSYRTITYSYDALGRRIERRSKTSGTESYTYDGQDVILDQNSSGAQTTYINGPGIDNKLKLTSGGASSYFLQDHLGSTIGLTDASGTVTSSATYDGYGRQTGALSTRYGYTGREMDPDTGLMFYRARWYDPQLGRFISEDPIGFEGGSINLMSYAGNNPLGSTDPSGLIDQVSHGWGNDLADYLDGNIDAMRDYNMYGEREWVANDINQGFWNLGYSCTNLLRIGTGATMAMEPEENNYGRAAFILMDI